jgi:hypothetical protein
MDGVQAGVKVNARGRVNAQQGLGLGLGVAKPKPKRASPGRPLPAGLKAFKARVRVGVRDPIS